MASTSKEDQLQQVVECDLKGAESSPPSKTGGGEEDGAISSHSDYKAGGGLGRFICGRCYRREEYTTPTLNITWQVDRMLHHCLVASVCVWDARLNIKDFRKLYGMDSGTTFAKLNLLDTIADTTLYLRLRLPESTGLRHTCDQLGQPMVPECKAYDIPRLLSCKRCVKRGRIIPIKNDWVLEVRDGHVMRSDATLAIEVSHVAPNVTPQWANEDFKEKLTILVAMHHQQGNVSFSSNF